MHFCSLHQILANVVEIVNASFFEANADTLMGCNCSREEVLHDREKYFPVNM